VPDIRSYGMLVIMIKIKRGREDDGKTTGQAICVIGGNVDTTRIFDLNR
jgi:hypothetical protein